MADGGQAACRVFFGSNVDCAYELVNDADRPSLAVFLTLPFRGDLRSFGFPYVDLLYKSIENGDYLFGDKPNRRSLGFDLLERESNLIFLDEIDKCADFFYSVFYTLFDNTIFKDAVYDVDVSGALIILTSNYSCEDEMKEKLGLPIYYRIDKFIHFEDFDSATIYQIVIKEIEERYDEFKEYFSKNEIYDKVKSRILSQGENARTIKNKVQAVLEEELFLKILKSAD